MDHSHHLFAKKTLASLTLWRFILLVSFLLPGCTNGKKTTPLTQPFSGQTVRIGIPQGLGLATEWETPLGEWSAQTGAEVQIDEITDVTATKSLTAALAAEADTLLLFPVMHAGDLTAANLLSPLSPVSLAADNVHWQDVFQGLREGVCSRSRQPTLVPLSSPVLVCYYREDLLEQAGLSPPETWDDYQLLLDKLPSWAPGLVAVEPWSESFRTTIFLSRAAALAKHPGFYSLYFDIETGQPLIDTAGFVRALEMSHAALVKMPMETLHYGPAECRREILAGRAALALTFETGPANPPLPFGPESNAGKKDVTSGTKTSGNIAARPTGVKFGFCRLPGSREVYSLSRNEWEPLADRGVNQVTLTGFAGLAACVSSKCTAQQAEASWNVLATLAAPEFAATFPPGTRGPCRESHVTNAATWIGSDLQSDEGQKYFNVVAKSLRDQGLVAEIPVPGHAEFRRALTKGLTKTISGSAPATDVLRDVAEEWRDIIKRQNLANSVSVRDCYRAVLGLPPGR